MLWQYHEASLSLQPIFMAAAIHPAKVVCPAVFLHVEERAPTEMEHPSQGSAAILGLAGAAFAGAAFAGAIDQIARARLATNSDEAFTAISLPDARTGKFHPRAHAPGDYPAGCFRNQDTRQSRSVTGRNGGLTQTAKLQARGCRGVASDARSASWSRSRVRRDRESGSSIRDRPSHPAAGPP
jgi:hypothetical protein